MAEESMLVDTGSVVSNLDKKKRDRQEIMQTFERIKRGRHVDMAFFRHYILSPTEMYHPADFLLDPPKIDRFLKLNLNKEKQKFLDYADKIKTLANLNQWDEIEKHTKDLAEMVSIDPRLVSELDDVLLKLLVEFVSRKQNPKLQSQVVIILQHFVSHSDSKSKQLVIEGITSSIIADLMSSEDCVLKMQALCLFRTMASIMPLSEFIAALDVALVTLTLLINDSTVYEELLCDVSMTLAIVCQVYPKLPSAKLQLVLDALKKLIECESSVILTYTCLGLVYLCDGREEMVFEKMDLGPLVSRLAMIIRVYRRKFRASTIAALTALGTIVRWGSDDDIEVIIEGYALRLLQKLLGLQDKQYVGNACWIISNITAGKKKHIRAVINSGLIDLLFCVVQNYKLLDVKKEAAWAISNAMYGVGSDEAFRNSCVEPLWNILKVFRADQQIISFCLEGLVISEGVQVIYNGQPINASELKKHLGTLRGGLFRSELKKPRYDVDNINFEDGVAFYVTRTVKGDVQHMEIRMFYKSSEEDSSNMVDQMEVDEPRNLFTLL